MAGPSTTSAPVSSDKDERSVPTILAVGTLAAELGERLGGYHVLRANDAPGVPALAETDRQAVRGIVAGGSQALTAELFQALPQLEVIAINGVGTDGVDFVAAKARGIAVSSTPDVLTDDVAELTIGMLLALLRHIPASDRFVRSGAWAAGGKQPLGKRLAGRTIGLVGMGRIGQAIAERLEPFGVAICYTTRHRKAELGYHWFADAVALAAVVDVLIVIVPGGAATQRLIDAAVLRALGPDGLLVNVARGSVVDEDALLEALQTGVIAGAALDVFSDEPHSSLRFAALDNVVLQPHQGSATFDARTAMAELVVANLDGWFVDRRLVRPAARNV